MANGKENCVVRGYRKGRLLGGNELGINQSNGRGEEQRLPQSSTGG